MFWTTPLLLGLYSVVTLYVHQNVERFAIRGDHEEVWGACDVVKPGAVSASPPDVTFASVRLRESARFTYEYDMNILWRPVCHFVKRRDPVGEVAC